MDRYKISGIQISCWQFATPRSDTVKAMKQLHIRGIVMIAVISLFLFSLIQPGWAQNSQPPIGNSKVSLEDIWGVQIVGIRQTAAGHMLDFRYKVIDPVKAAPLFVRQTAPYLIDQASGKSLTVPNMAKVGPLRSSNQPLSGRTYWMFFGNPGLVKAGSKVSVVIGDFRVENLTVM